MAYLSICIPTYEMHGHGTAFLRKNFEIFATQTFQNFEVVISDQSIDTDIEQLCNEYADVFEIKYIRNTTNRGNSSANLNNAIRHAAGTIIKVLFQDDFLYSKDSLEQTVRHLTGSKNRWLVSTYVHTTDGIHFYKTHTPRYNKHIYLGHNTIGTPSGLSLYNQNPPLFDEQLIWLMDCDYYKRCYELYGAPTILKTPTIVNRISKHQITHTIATRELRKKEYRYILSKYSQKYGRLILLINKVLHIFKKYL